MGNRKLDILLTTYPEDGTRNVGDHLITMSAIKLIQKKLPSYNPQIVFRGSSLDSFDDSNVRTILAPGFSVKDGVYPKIFALYSDLARLSSFFPVGCSFQNPSPSTQTYREYKYSDETKQFLRRISKEFGALPCRDQLIMQMLRGNSIDATYSGDLALYDDALIGRQVDITTSKVRSIAFTIQHKSRYLWQSVEILKGIARNFPTAKRYIAYHSCPNENSIRVAEKAKSMGFEVVDLSGDSCNLTFYDSIDLHIGYRLHGHISFLRRRKPSCLVIEDARSFGIANSPGLGAGCFNALSEDGVTPDERTPQAIFDFLDTEIQQNFSTYEETCTHIDTTYRTFVRPYFDDFASRAGWRPSFLNSFIDRARSVFDR